MVVAEDPCLKRYLQGLAEKTAYCNRYVLDGFFGYVGVKPREAVAFQRGDPLNYRFVDLVYEWLSKSGNSVSSMRTKMGCIRGFFVANRSPLPRDKHRFHSEKVPVAGELTVEEFKKILSKSNLVYRAAFLVMFQSGSGVGELLYINEKLVGHVWSEVRKGSRFVRLNMPGRKANRNVRPYYTFIGGDAVEALKHLFHSQGWRKDSVLFMNQYGAPLSAGSLQNYFRSQATKLGFIQPKTYPCLRCGEETVKRRGKVDRNYRIYYLCVSCGKVNMSSDFGLSQRDVGGIRYRMRTHELRDLFRTEWSRAQTYFGVASYASEFFMGHSIDPLKYNKIMSDKTFGLQQYRKALPMLNILSEDPRKIERSEVQDQLEASEAKVDALGREVSRIRKILEDPRLVSWLERQDKE